MNENHFEVLIIGAGVSGIGMACHLTRECPGKSYAIIERRDAIGGTWDLFRYPGIRSDSDMYTFGYNFRPWTGAKILADGASIKQYVEDTAAEYGVDRHIHYGRAVTSANWSSAERCWILQVKELATGRILTYTASFLVGCTGYYNYDAGHKPDFPGEQDFRGPVIHPQHWPQDLDYSGKRIVVIGSGATAVTLVPSLAARASHVTMLQRSPTYMIPVPSVDPVTRRLQKFLPDMLVYRLTRTRNIAALRTFYQVSRRRPQAVRRMLLGLVRKQLGGQVDMRHFSPDYAPWDQRVCAVADGDLFKVLRSGEASVVTDRIERFTETGIRLQSGQELAADIIITATGLEIQMLGGVELKVDDRTMPVNDTLIYKNVLVEGVPNAGMIFGYTNISWTLKADIAAEYLCRLLRHMDRKRYATVVPRDLEGCRTTENSMGTLDSGYIRRADDRLPRQGSRDPWKVTQDYLRDSKVLRHAPIEDAYLVFDGGEQPAQQHRRSATASLAGMPSGA